MDYSSQTVAQLRSLLNSKGILVPQAYLKKAELVEMCRQHFTSESTETRNVSDPIRRGRSKASRSSSSNSRESSNSSPRNRPIPQSARRKSSIGTVGHKSPSITIVSNLMPRSPPGKGLDISDSEAFRRTPSPKSNSAKPFSGRPSLAATSSRKISIVPLSTLPPRRKSTVVKPGSSWFTTISTILLVAAFVGLLVGIYLFTVASGSRVPLCNTDGSPHVPKSLCVPCPRLGRCSNGFVTSCAEHYAIRGDACVRDEAKFNNALAMVGAITSRLMRLKGQKECGEDVAEAVYPEQLRLWLRMDFMRLSDDEYTAAFDLALKGEKEGVTLPKHVALTQMGLMRSSFGEKSLSCRTREFLDEWLWTMILISGSSLYFGWKIRTWQKKRRLLAGLLKLIEESTLLSDGRVQGLSVTDLRDKGMPLENLDDRSARKHMNLILKAHPDIQSGEDMTRGGEMVFWSSQRLRNLKSSFQ